ncbi:hypothetical protein INR49_028630 [Caranx melampygus]|nr:hypothetical protein INR49_028630 [Caranx melampygus]
MHFDHTIHCSIVPFDFNLDAMFNADGDITMYGKHSAQLYGKFLMKAQPLAFASSHESRASVTQELDNGFSLQTTFDNNMDTLLSLQEQKTSLRLRSKMNEHAFNQDFSVYNTAERTGIEVSGTILTNILNTDSTDNQEFTISGFLKYDKNTDSHIIQIPLIENLPALLEGIKGFVVHVAEALRDYINNEEIIVKLEALPHHMSDFVAQLNIEENVNQLKQYFSDFTKDYAISMADVEASLTNLKDNVGKLLADLSIYIQHFAGKMKEIIDNGDFSETLFQNIQLLQNIFKDEYDTIKSMVIYMIDTISEMIQLIDFEKLRGSAFAFLHDIDVNYEIKAKLQTFMEDIKQIIEAFDMQTFVSELKRHIPPISINDLIDFLASDLPTEIFSDMIDYIWQRIQYFDILGKLNKFYTKMREMIVMFEAEKKIQAVLEKAAELIKQFRIEETVTAVMTMVKDADIPARFMQYFQRAISYLKSTEVKDIIQQLNMYIESFAQRVNSMSYSDFLDYVNQMIAKYTSYLNEVIRALEIPQKLEATIDFVNLVLSSVRGLMDRLGEIRIAEMIKSVKDIFDEVVLDTIKRTAEFVKQEIMDMDVKLLIEYYVKLANEYLISAMSVITDMFSIMSDVITKMAPEQRLTSEIEQIITGLITELKKVQLIMPSFTIPLTDLVVPSMTFSLDKLEQFEMPTQMDIPEFTILGFHTVRATTISIDDIRQKIIEFIDFIVNFDIKMPTVDVFFGDLTVSYLPTMPEIILPDITLPEIPFFSIPRIPVEKLVKSLQVPEIKLPTIPSELMVPCFGKIYGEIKFLTPIYTIKTSAEFQNSTENKMTPKFTGALTSQATSPSFEFLNYKLESSARIAIPKMSRILVAETLKFQHLAVRVDHQASVTLYGLSGQAQTKTAVKVTTAPYTADFMNTAFIAMEGGMSTSTETTYSHVVDLPMFNVRSEAALTQKTVGHLEGLSFTLTVDNLGTGKVNDNDGNHKSNMQLLVTPSIVTLTFSGDTDSAIFKMKQQISLDFGIFSHFKFNIHNAAEAPFIKNSLLVASGQGSFYDMKVELKADHDTELYGAVSGVLSNGLNMMARPFEVLFEFQNKGNAKLNIFETLIAKVDLQNDYSAIFKTDTQQMNTVAMARLNQYKVFYNLTVDNNENEAGIFVAIDGEANVDFLTSPISIPEIYLPFIDFRTPAISNLNLYEQTGLKNILTTTDQTVDVDAKIVYKKSQNLMQIPSVGNLNTELSVKSAIINLNVNAGLYYEDDLVFRFGATTASVFESLQTKLDGTTSLTTKRGIKLANSLSLENRHIEGTHDSSITMSTETFEPAVSVATNAKIALPILSLEANQHFVADTITKANAASTLRMNADFNVPIIKAAGKAKAEHSLKLEGAFEYISMESSTKANIDGIVLEDYLAVGVLDNEFNLYLNNNGLRSTSKIIADAKLNHGTNKVIGMDVNENLAVEASLSHLYAMLKYTGHNEANLFNFITNGKHIAQATIDFSPMSSLNADIEIDISQPSSLGELNIFEKTVAEVTAAKQKISTNGKFVSPLYTTNLAAVVDGNFPVLKVTFKSSATSVIVLLEYDMDAFITANLENEAANMISKAVLRNSEFNMNVNHVITQALGRQWQADNSVSQHTLNVDITSPTFTDMNLRYAAQRDGISASVATPSAGLLGFELRGRAPSQMAARVYSRYPSVPDVDFDIMVIRSSPRDDNKMNLQLFYNMEAPKVILTELKMRIPSIMFSFTTFADKYQITRNMEEIKNAVVTRVTDVYNAAINYDDQMSQLSIFFRNIIVEYQKTVQAILDVVIKVLRETQFQLPMSDQMTTLPEVLKKLTSSIAATLDSIANVIYENMEVYYSAFVQKISSMKLRMPIGEAINGVQILEQFKMGFRRVLDEVTDFVKNMESIDTMLVKIGETLKAIVEKSQEFVDSVRSDYLDAVFIKINTFYVELVKVIKNVIVEISALRMEQLSSAFENMMDIFINVVDQFNNSVYGYLQQASQEASAYVKLNQGVIELELPFHLQQ